MTTDPVGKKVRFYIEAGVPLYLCHCADGALDAPIIDTVHKRGHIDIAPLVRGTIHV